MLKRTPFFDFHTTHGAKLVDFAGWEMPLLYRSIVDEHEQTRKSGSMFDVSHMGRLYISGNDATGFLNRIVTRNVERMSPGQSRYSLVCNEQGGVMDDIIISRDDKSWIVVCNASNREKIVNHFGAMIKAWNLSVELDDRTESTAMVAIQGPKVIEKLSAKLPGADIKSLKRYGFANVTIMMFIKFTVFRSGYTGEDGVEIIFPGKIAGMAINQLGGSVGEENATIKPAGLGARDTLRMEAAMPLYGHELTETIDPLSAGLEWAVDLNKDFVGCAALKALAASGLKRKLVGLELEGKRIARQDTPVVLGGQTVGTVTSGTLSPTLGKSIAMAYVNVEHANEATMLAVDLKGSIIPAKIVKLPFYKRAE